MNVFAQAVSKILSEEVDSFSAKVNELLKQND
jgi:hypothetical protein